MSANIGSHNISAHATRYWLGLPGDALYSSRISYIAPQSSIGVFGVELRQFGLGLQSTFGVGVAYAYPIQFGSSNTLSAGICGRWIRNQYDLSQAYRFEDDPLFAEYGESSNGFGLDMGLKYGFRNLSAGLLAKNILKPNISLSAESGEGHVEPMEVNLGLAYSLFGWFEPAIQGGWSETEGITGSVGAEFRLFDGRVGLRTGYREGNLTFGIGINGSASLPLSFDYAMSYPDGALAKAGVTTHSVGMSAAIPQKQKESPPEILPWVDLITRKIPEQDDTLVFQMDRESPVRADILNAGNASADSFYVSAFRIDEDTLLLGSPIFIHHLPPGEKELVSWDFMPEKSGKGKIIIVADSDSLRTGNITEQNEDNNRLTIPYYIAGDVVADLRVNYSS
ncbi:MAG: type IX secretion system membrane protein PorP/SprF, partial [bacterium]